MIGKAVERRPEPFQERLDFIPLICAPVTDSPVEQRSTSSRNRLKKYDASCGPGEASGWYCTEKSGFDSCAKPSTVSSFRLT